GVRAEHARVQPREHRHDEARRVASRRRVLVARVPDEVAELRGEGLRVEPVAVTPGDAGHARAESAHDDRRRRFRPEATGLASPQSAHETDRRYDTTGAD